MLAAASRTNIPVICRRETFTGFFPPLLSQSFMEAGLWLLPYHGWFWTNSTPTSPAGSNLETGDGGDGVLDGRLHTPDFTAIQALVVFGTKCPPPPPPGPTPPTGFSALFFLPAGSYFHMFENIPSGRI